MVHHPQSDFNGLEHITTSVILLDQRYKVIYINPSAEALFDISAIKTCGKNLADILLQSSVLQTAIKHALEDDSPFVEHNLSITTYREHTHTVTCTVTPIHSKNTSILLEFQKMDQQLRIAKEERTLIQQQANSELLRNLAHEIRNPLGGLSGAAQLLEHELPDTSLREYTQVIIKEADRLHRLMDRLLAPHQTSTFTSTNIHEVLERVRSLLLAESADNAIENLSIQRDYDTSLPELMGDREKLIQAVLNIASNAAHALKEHQTEDACITLKTRYASQVTLSKKRYRVAIKLEIVDNGPGIPEPIQDKIFYPLVTGTASGTGLGLSLAQTFITQHQGTIDCESKPGRTNFTIFLPIESSIIAE